MTQEVLGHISWLQSYAEKTVHRVQTLEERNELLEKKNTDLLNRQKAAILAVNKLVKLYDKLVTGRYLADRSVLHDLLNERDELIQLQGYMKDVPRPSI
jgi:hypothetical protein